MSNLSHSSRQIEACGSEQIITFEKTMKVSLNDKEWLLEKWSTRKIISGTLDKVEKIKLRQREDRKKTYLIWVKRTSLSLQFQDSAFVIHCNSGDEKIRCSASSLSICKKLLSISQTSTSKEESQIQIRMHQYGASNWCVAVKTSAIQDMWAL